MVKRIIWADDLKLFASYLVVLGHVILFMGLDKSDVYSNPVYSYIYSFHMPLFMTLSGFFSNKILKYDFNIYKRVKQLLIPCVTLFCINVIFKIDTLNFWYLKSLLICYIIYCLLFKIISYVNNKLYIYILFIILCFITFPLISRIPYLSSYKIDFMLPYFGLGLLIYKNINYIDKYKEYFLFVFSILFCLFLLNWNECYIWYNSNPLWFDYKLLIFNHIFTFDPNSLLSYFIRLLTGLTGSIFFITFILFLQTKFSNNKSIFAKYGKYSLHIYIIQSYLVEINFINLVLPVNNVFLYSYIYCPIYALFVTFICVVLAKLLELNRYINFFLFGKEIQKK